MKKYKQIAIISYTHDIKNDPLGVQFFGKNSRIIFLPEKSIAGSPVRPGDRVVNFSAEVKMVARNPDPTRPYDMISADYYVGSQKAAKIYMDIRELDVSVRQPGKVYLLKVEQADETGEYKVMDVPCCVIRSFQHGLIELILPPQEEAVGFDPTKDARVTHMNESKIISGMGIEPFTITSKCLMTDNVTGLVTHTIEDGRLHLKYTTMGYMENIYAVEAVLSEEDTEKVVRNGFLDVSEYTQLKSQLSLNLAFDTEPTGIKYRAYDIYKPPYNVFLSILNDDNTGVEMNVRPIEVKYINIKPLDN